MVLTPGELAPSSRLYVIERGLALYGGRVLTSGKMWGDDMILNSEENMSNLSARAMTYLEVFHISRSHLLSLARQAVHACRK